MIFETKEATTNTIIFDQKQFVGENLFSLFYSTGN